jgi:hypothetical protein
MTSANTDGVVGETSKGTSEENPIALVYTPPAYGNNGSRLTSVYEGLGYWSDYSTDGKTILYFNSKTGKKIPNPYYVMDVQSDVTTLTSLIKNQSKYLPVVVNSPYGPLLQLTDFTSAKDTGKYQYVGSKVNFTDSNNQQIEYSGYYIPTTAATATINWQNTGTNSDGKILAGGSPVPAGDPNEYRWNLPPHRWSLPYFAGTDPAAAPKDFVSNKSSDRYRRGRIWWKYSDPNLKMVQNNGSDLQEFGGSTDRKYGFQFLWNPETFSTQVAVQMDATPTSEDRFLGAVGAFPATETITFNIRVDRTNDFACANSYFKRPSNIVGPNNFHDQSSGLNSFINKDDVTKFVDFYRVKGGWTEQGGGVESYGASIESKLVDLFQRGTIADIEFLYRAINGPGPGDGTYWVNNRGILTSDIGFLQPTLLNIDIGPLAYQGYVTSMSVNHISFTRDMIPIRSDVTISLNLLATAGLTSQYAVDSAKKKKK